MSRCLRKTASTAELGHTLLAQGKLPASWGSFGARLGRLYCGFGHSTGSAGAAVPFTWLKRRHQGVRRLWSGGTTWSRSTNRGVPGAGLPWSRGGVTRKQGFTLGLPTRPLHPCRASGSSPNCPSPCPRRPVLPAGERAEVAKHAPGEVSTDHRKEPTLETAPRSRELELRGSVSE